MRYQFKTLREVTEKLIYTVTAEGSADAPDVVYHYTTAEGLAGILSSGRVWATDCRFLNDRGENKLGVSEATAILQSGFEAQRSPFARKLIAALPTFYASDDAEQNFIFSTSSRRDDLAQWRMYANDGQGFTVGFDAQKIRQLSRQNAEFAFAKVNYNLRDLQHQIRLAGTLIDQEVASLIELQPGGRDTIIASGIAELGNIVSFYAAMFKHSSFKSEREWRITSFIDDGDPGKEIKVRTRRGSLIPYIDLDICKNTDYAFPVISVGIGPGFTDPAVSYAVKRLCAQHNQAVEVYVADTPFRRV